MPVVMGQYRGMSVIRNYNIDNNDNIMSPCRCAHDFDHGIIIIVISAEHCCFIAFQTHVEGIDFPDCPVRKLTGNDSYHKQKSIDPLMTLFLLL